MLFGIAAARREDEAKVNMLSSPSQTVPESPDAPCSTEMDVYITSTNNWLSSVKMGTGDGTSLITSGCKPERHAFMDRVNCAECTPSCSHLTARAIS